MENSLLEHLCKKTRKQIVKYGYESGRGHISSSLSLVEVLISLYFNIGIDIDKIKEKRNDRDRIILSKGHAGLALYLVLIEAGIFDKEILEGFTTPKSKLSTHPVVDTVCGIEMSAGSLGQGIGFASGVALSEKINNSGYRTYVIVGDGELQEGSNWESMLFISQMQLSKLTLIVDRNGKQITGNVENIIAISPLKEKLESFGFKVIEVNGHDIKEITEALIYIEEEKPLAIIANTIKGKGISFIEDKDGWHGKGLTFAEYQDALKELGE